VHATAPLFVALGNLESKLLARQIADIAVDRPIYICGLPRAGTTISLQMLSEHPSVAAHRYADFLMPYVPYGWNWLFPRVPVDAMRKPQPRIHRDRIQVSRDSVEMCEEMIWEQFFPFLRDESQTSILDASVSNPAFERFYAQNIQKLLLAHGKPRYASKAIMCVLRMQYIRKIFPDARFLLYVRNPIDQIASLVKQDRIWDEIDKEDPRQIEIIEMTGHHEFGSRQILPNVGNSAEVRDVRTLFDEGHRVAARARLWAYVYDFVLKQIAADPSLRSAVCVVRYEDLCNDSLQTIDRIVEHTGLAAPPFAAIRAAYAEKLSFPDYYKPNFSTDELGAIVDAAAPVAAQFGYDVKAIGRSNATA
jgi:hypothetical protein